jgi:hypothetical protein
VLSVLSALQWYDLLEWGKLSVYDAVYRFCRDWEESSKVVPKAVMSELLCGVVLGLFWCCDVIRPHTDLIGPTDAF